MRIVRSIVTLVAIAVVAGCSSGGGGGHVTPVPTATPTPAVTGTHVQMSFNTLYPLPTNVAVQIGTGAWTAATLQGATLSVVVPTGTTKYAMAFICPPSDAFGVLVEQEVIEATTSDPLSYTEKCQGTLPTSSETGFVDATAIAGTNDIEVIGNFDYGMSVAGTSGSFSATLPNGINDIAAVAEAATGDVLGVKIVRNQTVQGIINGGNPITLAASDATTSAAFSVTNVSPGYNATPASFAGYYTPSGLCIPLMGTTTGQYAAVPASEALAGDYYDFGANDADTTTHEDLGVSENTIAGGSAVSLALPSVWAYTAPAAAALPTFTFNYTGFTGDAVVENEAQIAWTPNGTTNDDFNVYASAAYVGAAGTVAMPNLTGLTGFLTSPPAATSIQWMAVTTGGTYSLLQAVGPTTGTLDYAQITGTYSEP